MGLAILAQPGVRTGEKEPEKIYFGYVEQPIPLGTSRAVETLPDP